MALVRLQKLLSERGVASRRKAEELIAGGHVKVNGRVASVGDKADDRKDIIHVRGKKLAAAAAPVYIALHKPRGFITTMSDEHGRKCVEELVRGMDVSVYPVGRLDRESEGLLLMTNDGALMDEVLRARNGHEKEYIVEIDKPVTEEFVQGMAAGVPILDTVTRPCQVEKIGRNRFRIILTQGLNRQIRRMCEYFGCRVVSLKRVRIVNIRLGNLPLGGYRELTKTEEQELRRQLNPGIQNGKAVSDKKRNNSKKPCTLKDSASRGNASKRGTSGSSTQRSYRKSTNS